MRLTMWTEINREAKDLRAELESALLKERKNHSQDKADISIPDEYEKATEKLESRLLITGKRGENLLERLERIIRLTEPPRSVR